MYSFAKKLDAFFIRVSPVLIIGLFSTLVIFGQQKESYLFNHPEVNYTIEFPTTAWHAVFRTDIHKHAEFWKGGDPQNGILKVRKHFFDQPVTADEIASSEEILLAKYLSGYIKTSDRDLEFREGHVQTYEFTSGGIQMSGAIFYLKYDIYTFYSLHFTGTSTTLQTISDDINAIVRSFTIKE